MTTETTITRKTVIRLTNDEIKYAITDYLKKKGIPDTDQYVTFKIHETRDERGTECDVVIENFNTKNNLVEQIKNQ
jgi:hypothetical protein